jgi:hypothetical protein
MSLQVTLRASRNYKQESSHIFYFPDCRKIISNRTYAQKSYNLDGIVRANTIRPYTLVHFAAIPE